MRKLEQIGAGGKACRAVSQTFPSQDLITLLNIIEDPKEFVYTQIRSFYINRIRKLRELPGGPEVNSWGFHCHGLSSVPG